LHQHVDITADVGEVPISGQHPADLKPTAKLGALAQSGPRTFLASAYGTPHSVEPTQHDDIAVDFAGEK
jgi:hypothetical protein